MYNINTFIIMKSFLNYSKLAIATLITSSVFVACSDEITETTCDTPYVVNSGNIRSAGDAVDLGLPSGTKWASKNIGAASESDNGVLFVWGDATGNQLLASTATSYTDVTDFISSSVLFDRYKAAEGSVGFVYDTINVHKESISLSEFTLEQADNIRKARLDSIEAVHKGKKLDRQFNAGNSVYDIIVNVIDSTKVNYFKTAQGDYKVETGFDVKNVPVYSIVADANHDPATANWGDGWRMPTTEQVQELIDNCTWEFTGSGYLVTTKSTKEGVKGNHIFLPAAGFRYGDKWYGNGNAGYYATGEIWGNFHFPSMVEQKDDSKGSVSSSFNMPNMLIFQHGQFDNSVSVNNKLSTSYGVSIRPVAK